MDFFQKALRKKCPYSKSFWSAFSRIRTEYGEIWSICLYSIYSIRMQENTDQNNSEYGQFLHSEAVFLIFNLITLFYVGTVQ